MKSWLHSRKEDARLQHQATERQTLEHPIPVRDLFTIAGTSITCPHPRATGIAEQDVNCGCTTLSRYPGDDIRDAALIAHHVGRGFLDTATLERRIAARSES